MLQFDKLAVGAKRIGWYGVEGELSEAHVALQRLLILDDRLEQLVAHSYLRLALVALGRGQAKCQVCSTLRTVVPMVQLQVTGLSLLADCFNFSDLRLVAL